MIVVTGASGFVGRTLVNTLDHKRLTSLGRNPTQSVSRHIKYDLSQRTDIRSQLSGCEVLVHCAARVHVMNDDSATALENFRSVNTHGTEDLARQAAEAGVKQFIFISSIKVNGESTEDRPPFKALDAPGPEDPYAISKFEAEEALKQISKDNGMAVTIIRPPLVYGPGVGANFLKLIKLVDKRIPLPFGSVRNKRSMVAIDNLVDLINVCIINPKAFGQTFLVSDGRDVSTAELINEIAQVKQKRPLLVPFPPFLLNQLTSILGKKELNKRLSGSLQVDISDTMSILDWSPSVSMRQQLIKMLNEKPNIVGEPV